MDDGSFWQLAAVMCGGMHLWMFIIVLLWPKKHKTEKGLLRYAIFSLYRLKIDITYATNRNCVLEFGVKQ